MQLWRHLALIKNSGKCLVISGLVDSAKKNSWFIMAVVVSMVAGMIRELSTLQNLLCGQEKKTIQYSRGLQKQTSFFYDHSFIIIQKRTRWSYLANCKLPI